MLNINAVVAATKNPALVGATSQHICAQRVRECLEFGGIDTTGRPRLARQYTGYLPKIGFAHIGTLNTDEAQASFTSSGAQPGDIAVYMKPGAPAEPGHICLWNGSQWCSDFRQNRMNVYRAPVVAYIYRYTGQIDNSPVDPMMFGAFGAADLGGGTLDGESLAKACPPEVNFKGMWSRYQLRMGPSRSSALKEITSCFMDMAFGSFGSNAITTSEADSNAMQIIDFFKGKGLTTEQACGFVGCWGAESMCNPHAYNKQEKAGTFKGSTANGSGYGAGLAQWSHTWKDSLQKLIGRNDPIENWDLDTQLNACWLDLQKGNKSRFLPKLTQCRTVTEAVDAVLRGYENGGNGAFASVAQIDKYTWCGGYTGAMNTRVGFGDKWYKMYIQKQGGTA